MNKEELKDEFELDIEFEVDKNNRVDMNQVIELISAYNKLFRTYKQLKTQIGDISEELEEHSANAINKQVSRGVDLVNQQKEFISYLEDKINSIEPKGTGINYNCEYDSEEDYVMAMQEQSRLNTLKEILQKYRSIIGGDK